MCLCVLLLAFLWQTALASTEIFDEELLKQRGLNTSIADYFREAPRFKGGEQVDVTVNGERKGQWIVRLDKAYELCFDKKLLDQAGLVVPEPKATPKKQSPASACMDFLARFPSTVVKLHPKRLEIELIVPSDALKAQDTRPDISAYSSGGTAGMLNYDFLTQRSEFASSQQDYQSGNFDAGFNAGDWIVRSRQSYVGQNGESTRRSLYTYAQRTFPRYRTLVQTGQIDLSSSLFAGAPITGVQFLPETALSSSRQSGARIEGIAHSQARVEVGQNGALLYATVVPSGPFVFDDVPLLSGRQDVTVTVIESNGARSQYVIPASSLNIGAQGAAPGYAFAMGKMRSFDTVEDELPWVATGTYGWRAGRSTLTSGLVSAESYFSTGIGWDTPQSAWGSFSAQELASHNRDEAVMPASPAVPTSSIPFDEKSVNGLQSSLAWRGELPADILLSLSVSQRSHGYRDLSDIPASLTTSSLNTRYRTRYTSTLNWRDPRWGSFSGSYSTSTQFVGPSQRYLVGSWGTSIGAVSVSFNVEHNLDAQSAAADENNLFYYQTSSQNTYYLSLSMPMGERRSISASLNDSDSRRNTSVRLSEQVNEYVDYQVAGSYSGDKNADAQSDVSANVGLLPRYFRSNLSYSAGENNTNYAGQFQGGMAMHKHGVSLSPYPVQDTFGIVSVGKLSGVQVDTPAGPVWTDKWGQAVLPQLTPYTRSRVEISTKSLPRDADIRNGTRDLDVGRGSVSHVAFGVVQTRRFLLTVNDPAGVVLPKGAGVFDAKEQFVTAVLDNQQIFLADGYQDGLTVSLTADKQCKLRFNVPSKPTGNAYYEKVEATCELF